MKDIKKIMEAVYLEPERYTESELKDSFGESAVNKFVQFSLRGNPKYAEKNENTVKIRLTSEGVRAYHRMETDQQMLEMNERMVRANQSYALVTIIIGVTPISSELIKIIPEQYRIFYYLIHIGLLAGTGWVFLRQKI